MPAIDQVREGAAAAQADHRQAADQAQTKAIDRAMKDLKKTLAEPQFTGDVQTALIHNMGREAFTDSEATAPYIDLAAQIEAQQTEGEATPVMVVTLLKNDRGESAGVSSALVKVDGDTAFKSSVERKEGVSMHAFTDTTADVVTRKLSLAGQTTTVTGDITRPGSTVGKPTASDGLVLRESQTADGNHGKGMPSDYAFRDTDSDILRNEASNTFVGWQEVEKALIQQLNGSGLQEAFKLKEFFAASGDITELEKNAPKLADVIKHATAFQTSVGQVAAQ
jgi:hypothetical protein